ncbi:hypothetical protein DAI22_09g146000 [Oryza sativa Japonica Group]|nr:hypothetical protein DAI22_09g146000 [Oryza sativa Japonica Group]
MKTLLARSGRTSGCFLAAQPVSNPTVSPPIPSFFRTLCRERPPSQTLQSVAMFLSLVGSPTKAEGATLPAFLFSLLTFFLPLISAWIMEQ